MFVQSTFQCLYCYLVTCAHNVLLVLGSSRNSSKSVISEYNYTECLAQIEKELTKLEDSITEKLVECALLEIELVMNLTPPEFTDVHQISRVESDSAEQIKQTEDKIKCLIPVDTDFKS
ncbi:uncharacterized protein LOC106460036 [Limulus polyphemus]|uniref:Uncharacterized protein LOC106460036 n=1 Tax=Limulus polyphemus TaxID=6850 RepID=A0ABM1SFC3_LIMPO|nr:uncharacterized protein LOC106460036 [Limulus polyphemus]